MIFIAWGNWASNKSISDEGIRRNLCLKTCFSFPCLSDCSNCSTVSCAVACFDAVSSLRRASDVGTRAIAPLLARRAWGNTLTCSQQLSDGDLEVNMIAVWVASLAIADLVVDDAEVNYVEDNGHVPARLFNRLRLIAVIHLDRSIHKAYVPVVGFRHLLRCFVTMPMINLRRCITVSVVGSCTLV